MTNKEQKNREKWDVAIVGGGMVGMSLAIALARTGISTGVIERARLPDQLEPQFDGRVSAVAEGSKRFLEAIGVWEHIAPYAQPIMDIRVSDGDAPFFLHFDHQEAGDVPMGYIVENRYIRYGLHRTACLQALLTIKDETALAGVEVQAGRALLREKSGKEIACALMVGADGKQSNMRKWAGIGEVQWDYKQKAIVCTIHHALPHNGLAQERFLPAGAFAVLPMTDEGGVHRSSLVWVEPEDRVGIYLDLSESELLQEIQERVGDYLGQITHAGKCFVYPLSLMHANTYIAERLALVGDAAHGIHPIAGQGVNLGFRDVTVLAELLTKQQKLGMDIGCAQMLRHYERWRRFDNTAMLIITDGLNRLFGYNAIPVKWARRMGLWGVSKVPSLKRFFITDAMGLTGDLPELVKKKA